MGLVLPLKAGDDVGGWTVVRELGGGGQGTVFLVRSPARAQELSKLRKDISYAIRQIGGAGTVETYENAIDTFIAASAALTKEEHPESLGALKAFNFEGQRGEAARDRLSREIEVLSKSENPAVVRLLAADASAGWMITAYQAGGTMEDISQRYKGNAGAAIRALLPIVRAVATFHEQGIVHRDIKPNNIFVSADQLVLGDFGIVFYSDDRGRLTRTFERVGPHDWMAPWANVKKRLEDVNPTFDVFPLAKVLWSMISGEPMLPFWWFDHEEYNLEHLFPQDPAMQVVNHQILSKCIVEQEASCLSSATQLVPQLEKTLVLLERGGELLVVGRPRPCRVCGVGNYDLMWFPEVLAGTITYRLNFDRMKPNEVREEVKPLTVHSYRCNHCGHIQLFHFAPNDPPAGWVKAAK